MTNYLKAMNELIEHFGNRPTLLVGHSRGGSMAVLGGTTIAHVNAFIDIMGRASAAKSDEEWQKAGYKLERRDLPDSPSEIYEYKLSYSFVEDSLQYDSMARLQECTKPKLFVKGSQDITIPQGSIEEAFEISAEPKQMETIDSDHDYRKHPELIEEVNVLIGKFLERNSL
jgi:pimeloyl-ACP methyl ester carboxylesterase